MSNLVIIHYLDILNQEALFYTQILESSYSKAVIPFQMQERCTYLISLIKYSL